MGNQQSVMLSNVSEKYCCVKNMKKLSLSPISKRSSRGMKREDNCCYSQMEVNLSEEEYEDEDDDDDKLTQSNSVIKQVKTFNTKCICNNMLRKQHRLNTNKCLVSTTYHQLLPPIINITTLYRRCNSMNSIHFAEPYSNNENNESSFSLITTDDIDPTPPSTLHNTNTKANDIRFSYFTKLITHNTETNYTPSPTQLPNKTFITKTFFDFDTFFFNMQYIINSKLHIPKKKLTLKQTEQFAKIEFTLLRLLTLCLSKGEVIILTNSSLTWVDYSLKKFYPSLMNLKPKIKFINCKCEYEHKYPKESKLWKIKSLIKHLYITSMKDVTRFKVINCIYFGNLSLNDNNNALKLKPTHYNIDYVLKMIKTNTSINLDHFNKQLLLIINEYTKIHSLTHSTTITIESNIKHQ